MIASLYPMEESKTDIEDGFTEGRPVVVRMDNNHFVCGKSRIRMYDRYGTRRNEMTELMNRYEAEKESSHDNRRPSPSLA